MQCAGISRRPPASRALREGGAQRKGPGSAGHSPPRRQPIGSYALCGQIRGQMRVKARLLRKHFPTPHVHPQLATDGRVNHICRDKVSSYSCSPWYRRGALQVELHRAIMVPSYDQWRCVSRRHMTAMVPSRGLCCFVESWSGQLNHQPGSRPTRLRDEMKGAYCTCPFCFQTFQRHVGRSSVPALHR